jgi:hypothetical protein
MNFATLLALAMMALSAAVQGKIGKEGWTGGHEI